MKAENTYLGISVIIRSTNDKDYFQMFFSGTEELVGKLNEEKSAWALQRELERISKRTDFKIRDVVWQGAWRYDVVIRFEVTIRTIPLDQTFGWPNHSERTESSLLEVSKSYNKDK